MSTLVLRNSAIDPARVRGGGGIGDILDIDMERRCLLYLFFFVVSQRIRKEGDTNWDRGFVCRGVPITECTVMITIDFCTHVTELFVWFFVITYAVVAVVLHFALYVCELVDVTYSDCHLWFYSKPNRVDSD